MYQKAGAPGEPIAPNLELTDTQSLSVLPYHVPILPCGKPKHGPDKREQEFKVGSTSVAKSYKLSTLG